MQGTLDRVSFRIFVGGGGISNDYQIKGGGDNKTSDLAFYEAG